jgi:hypothetical protein
MGVKTLDIISTWLEDLLKDFPVYIDSWDSYVYVRPNGKSNWLVEIGIYKAQIGWSQTKVGALFVLLKKHDPPDVAYIYDTFDLNISNPGQLTAAGNKIRTYLKGHI